MVVRFLHAEPGRVGQGVRARAAVLAQTRSLLVVAARLPAPVLRREFEAEGVDLSRVFLLDVTSHGIPPTAKDPEHEAYLPGPALLELIAKRAQQIIRAKAERPVAVLVDDVATFAQYNPPEALVEIFRHAISLRGPNTTIECVLSGGEPRSLGRLARSLDVPHFDLLPSGEIAQRDPQAPSGGAAVADLGLRSPADARIERDPTQDDP